MNRKLLITGGSGYLGRHLTVKAAESYDVYTTYQSSPDRIKAGQPLPLDLTDRAAVLRLIDEVRPQAIIHTAACNPGGGDEATMMAVNGTGSGYVAEAAVAVGARLVHVSTDALHDGRQAPYADDAPPTPIYAYGRSKAAAEAEVARIDPQAAIVRTSLIYGLDEMDNGTRNFVWLLEKGKPLKLFSDVIRQPMWVETLSEALLRLIDIDFRGPLNVAGRQSLTREAFARRMLAHWQIDPGDHLQSGRAADVSDTIPLDLRLSVAKGEKLLGMTFLGVDEVLAAQTR